LFNRGKNTQKAVSGEKRKGIEQARAGRGGIIIKGIRGLLKNLVSDPGCHRQAKLGGVYHAQAKKN